MNTARMNCYIIRCEEAGASHIIVNISKKSALFYVSYAIFATLPWMTIHDTNCLTLIQ